MIELVAVALSPTLLSRRDGESSDLESTGEGCIISHSLHDLLCIGCSSVQVPTWSQLVSPRATEGQTGTSSKTILLVSVSAIEREGRRQEEEKVLHGQGALRGLLRWLPQVSPEKIVLLMYLFAQMQTISEVCQETGMSHTSRRVLSSLQKSHLLLHELVLRQNGIGRPEHSCGGG